MHYINNLAIRILATVYSTFMLLHVHLSESFNHQCLGFPHYHCIVCNTYIFLFTLLSSTRSVDHLARSVRCSVSTSDLRTELENWSRHCSDPADQTLAVVVCVLFCFVYFIVLSIQELVFVCYDYLIHCSRDMIRFWTRI